MFELHFVQQTGVINSINSGTTFTAVESTDTYVVNSHRFIKCDKYQNNKYL